MISQHCLRLNRETISDCFASDCQFCWSHQRPCDRYLFTYLIWPPAYQRAAMIKYVLEYPYISYRVSQYQRWITIHDTHAYVKSYIFRSINLILQIPNILSASFIWYSVVMFYQNLSSLARCSRLRYLYLNIDMSIGFPRNCVMCFLPL